MGQGRGAEQKLPHSHLEQRNGDRTRARRRGAAASHPNLACHVATLGTRGRSDPADTSFRDCPQCRRCRAICKTTKKQRLGRTANGHDRPPNGSARRRHGRQLLASFGGQGDRTPAAHRRGRRRSHCRRSASCAGYRRPLEGRLRRGHFDRRPARDPDTRLLPRGARAAGAGRRRRRAGPPV